MRRYTADEERRIRMQAMVRDWTRAGLLDRAETERIDPQLRTDLARTNVLLRAALALFTAVVVGAAVALVTVTFHLSGDTEVAVMLSAAAVACFAVADAAVGAFRWYRYGVEEALGVLAAAFASIAALAYANIGHRAVGHVDLIAALAVGAVANVVVYRRFGFVYAAVAAMVCAGLIPFAFDMSEWADTTCAAAIFAGVFVVARTLYRRMGDEYPGDEYAAIEAAACAGVYLSLNLHALDDVASWLFRRSVPSTGVFYWSTYAAIWIVPGAALLDAIRAKDRRLLDTAVALALVTLVTNKPYLGMARQSWDPMLLGGLLVGGAIALRRWLARGPGAHRAGYTAERISAGDRDLLQLAANTSVAWHGRVYEQQAPATSAPPSFDGGRSGGGGAAGDY